MRRSRRRRARAVPHVVDEIAALARDEELGPELRALRLAQYLVVVAGGDCPEVAWDPVALRLRALASLGAAARVRAAIASLLDETRRLRALAS